MKIAVYGSESRLGLVSDRFIIDANYACANLLASEGHSNPYDLASSTIGYNLATFLTYGSRSNEMAKRIVAFFENGSPRNNWLGPRGEKIVHDLSSSTLKAPLVSTHPKIMCAGGNIIDHALALASLSGKGKISAEQLKKEKSKEPVNGFYKQASSIVGTGENNPYPLRTRRLDYEGEIALIVGRTVQNIPASMYLDYTFGFAVFNDFSIRDDLLKEGTRSGFSMRKNFQGCGSMGPWITSKDEISDPENLPILTKVNGEVRQNGATKDMIKKFGEIIDFVSSDIVLYPGDVITSGTCSGTAMDSTPRDKTGNQSPERFLLVCDVVEVSSTQLGKISNRVVGKA